MNSNFPPQPGATYKFVVSSTEEAVQTIRTQLGESAKVLSVRQLSGGGVLGLFSKPKIEVIVQLPAAEPDVVPVAVPENVSLALSATTVDRSVAVSSSRLHDLPEPAQIARDVPTRLPELLRRAGFSEAMTARLLAAPELAASTQKPLHHLFADLGQLLRRAAEPRKPMPLPARAAFLGLPGVGRTTALCKWLAREVFEQQRTGRVMKAEFDRPNPTEDLAVYCEALGLSLETHAADVGPRGPAGFSPIAQPAGEFLYVDLPAISLRNPVENTALRQYLDQAQIPGRVLVLHAAYDHATLRRAYAAGRDLGATHLVFTHLDEVEHWGKLWDFFLDGSLTPLFLGTGPSLTGDLESQPLNAVLRRTLPGA